MHKKGRKPKNIRLQCGKHGVYLRYDPITKSYFCPDDNYCADITVLTK